MSAIDLELATRLLILKIYTITGWPVPSDELKNILVDQLSRKIKESYPNVNEKEVEYAFRHNLTVKDWGKSMNLVLIDEVLSGYLERRSDVSRMEEHYRLGAKQLPSAEEDRLTDEDFIEACRSVYSLTKKYGLIDARCYDVLVNQGKIKLTEEEKEEIKVKARSLFFAAENKQNVVGLSVAEIERYIMRDCKKIGVAKYFEK